MCQPSLSCAVSLVLNQKCGIHEPVVEQAIRKVIAGITSIEEVVRVSKTK